MIAVTGASGHLGRATLESLLAKKNSQSLIAIARDREKVADFAGKGVDTRQGDYTDRASMITSLAGTDILLLVSSSATGDERVHQHKQVIDAAKEVGVKHIVYTSATNPSPTSSFAPAVDHFRTENLLEESGLTYTIFRNNLYLDVLPMILSGAVQSGKLYYPAGDGKVSFALRADIAEALANVLTGEGYANKLYDIGATTAWSFSDIAEVLSSTGNPVEYIDIPISTYETALAKHLPVEAVKIFSGMAQGIIQGDFDQPSPALETLLGREPTGLRAFLANKS